MRKKLTLLALLTILLTSTVPILFQSFRASAQTEWSDWPMFHHDSQRIGAGGGGIETTTDTLFWTFPVQIPAPSGVPSSPVVDKNGVIYVGSMDNYLYAIDPLSGQEKWHCYTTTYGKISSAPAISPDGTRIYVCTHESSGTRPNVFAIDTATGDKLWTGMPQDGLTLPDNDWVGSSNPAVIDEGGTVIIYVCGNEQYAGKYRLYRIKDNGLTGSLDWLAPYPEFPMYMTMQGAVSPSPAVGYGGTIYLGAKGEGSTDGSLHAINPDKTIKWSVEVATTSSDAGFSPAVYVSPVDIDGRVQTIYVGTSDYRMCKVVDMPGSPPTDPTWVYTNLHNEIISTCPAIADLDADGHLEIVFASTAMNIGHVYAITDMGITTTLLWETTIPGATSSSPALGFLPYAPPYQYRVFLGSCDRNIYTLAGWSGAILASYTTGSSLFGVTSSPAVACGWPWLLGGPGWVFVTSNDGYLYAFNPPTLLGPAHDLMVKTVRVPDPEVYPGWAIKAFISNRGNYSETANVTAYLDDTIIGAKATPIPPEMDDRIEARIPFEPDLGPDLNLYVNYTLRVEVSPVSGETILGDNLYIYGRILIKMTGDVNCDRKINILDIFAAAMAFGATTRDPRYDVRADLDNNDLINIVDIVGIALSFGREFSK